MASFQERLDAMKSGAPSTGAPATTNANAQQTTSASNDFQSRLDAMKAGWTSSSTTYEAPEVLSTASDKDTKEKKSVFEQLTDFVQRGKDNKLSAIEQTADYYKENAEKNPDTRTWLQKGTISDGYKFGDVSKGVAASVSDAAENVGAGILGLGEKFADAATQLGAWSYGGLKQSNPGAVQPSYSFSLEDREKEQEKAKGFISKDLYDEQAISKKVVGAPARWLGIDTEKDSFLGEKTDALAESGGQLLGTAALQAVGVPWFMTTGLSSFGGSLEEAYNEGADFKEAGASAAISAAAEILSEKISGGIKFKGKTLDDVITKKLAETIADKTFNTLAQTGVAAIGEGLEELLSGYVSAIGKKLTYADDKTLAEIFSREEALESFIGGALLGGGMGLINNVRGGDDTQSAAPKAAENPIAEKAEISPSEAVSPQAANVTGESAQADTAYQGAPGFEAEAEGIYGTSVGAAAPAVGPMVETQNKAITKNINLGEESRAANQPAPHEQISEALSLARAGAQIAVDGEGNIVNFEDTLNDLLEREKWSGVDSDTAQLLLKEAEKRADAESVKRIAERMAREGTEAAQLLQSRKKWIEASPANRLAAIYNWVDKFAKSHKAVKGGKIEIPDELAQEYLRADSEAGRDEAISKMQRYVASQAKSTLLEKWTALRYVNMLGNFKTQIRNIGGNLIMKAQYFAKNEAAALIEAIADRLSGGRLGRSKSLAVGQEWMKAAKGDFANVENEILSNGKYSGENFKGEFAEGVEKARKILPPVLEQYRRATNWAMDTGDIIFGKAAYARALAGYLKANGIQPQQLMAGNVDTELLEKARAYAINQAQEATFRDNNAFSDWISRIGRREDTLKAAKVLTEGLLPFRRTPANVLLRAEEFSPLGLLNTAVKAVQSRKADSDITASDIIDSLAKSLTGSGLLALGYILADQGLLRAAGSDEDEEFDALMNTQDWSIVIPGVGTYTFDWAAPASLIMFTGAQLSELMSDGELSFADVEGAFTGLSEPLVQMSMLSGVNDTLDSIKFSDNNLVQMAGQLAVGYLSQGLTNTLLGQIERSTEAERMSTYTEADSPLPEWLQRSIGKASAKTPGWDYQQTEYLNEFGETENSSVGERVLENLFSPGYFEAEKSGGVYDVVAELRERLGVDAFPDAYPPNSVKNGKESYALSQEERSRYQETRGQAAADYLEAVDGDSDFSRLTSQQQINILDEIMGRANEEAKIEALENKGVSVEQTDKDEVIDRMTPSQYIDWLISGTKQTTPAGYKSGNPDWQNFERAVEVLPPQTALNMMYAYNESAAKKVDKALQMGVSIEDAVAYYRAITQRTAAGKAPTQAEINQRLAALGLDTQTRGDLAQAFKDEKK